MAKIGNLITSGSNSCDEYDWEDLNYHINSSKFATEHFKVEVKNFGWRSLDGTAFFKASNLTTLLSAMLPSTECNFKVYNYGKGFAVQNYHHDSPTGDEWYYVTPIAVSTFNRRA